MTRRVVMDLEGNGLLDTITELHCAVFKDIDTDEVTKFVMSFGQTQDMLDFLNECTYVVAHNGIGFDYPALKKLHDWEPPEGCELIDSLVMSRLLNPDRIAPKGTKGPHSVEAWGKRFGRWKPEHEDWSKYTPEMLHRCSEDTEIQMMMYRALCAEASVTDQSKSVTDIEAYAGSNIKWNRAMLFEHKSAWTIFHQSENGCYFEKEYAEECIGTLDTIIDGIEDELLEHIPLNPKQKGASVSKPFKKNGEYTKMVLDWYDHLNYDSSSVYIEDPDMIYMWPEVSGPFTRIEWDQLNFGSDKQVKEWLYTLGWKPDEWNYKKDKQGKFMKDENDKLIRTSPKITISSLENIDGELGPKLALRSKSAHRRSQIQGWVDRCRDDHRISCDANPQGTNTGRMKHRGVANVPKPNVSKETHELIYYPDKQKVFFGSEMRSMFSAGDYPNRVLIGRDASGLELRCFAHYINDPEYTDLILHGDIHTHNQHAAGLPTRDDAKTFIYAFLYGAGVKKLGSILVPDGTDKEMTEAGKEMKEQFLTANPSLAKLIKGVQSASGRGWLLGLDGRKLHMRKSDGRIQRSKALNTLLQGAGAIIMTYARTWLYDEVIKRGWDEHAIKVIDYHDEETWECGTEIAEDLKELMIQSVVEAGKFYNFNCPLDADARIGRTWAEIH